MSNRDKVVKLAAKELQFGARDGTYLGERIADALANAGLLTPDLPEPSRRSIEGYHTAHPWAEWDAGHNRVIALKEGEPEVVIQDVGDPELCITMHPDEARDAAHALLAAADETEGE